MAKGRKTGGRDFKPGQSGNTEGRPKLPEAVKIAANMTRVQALTILSEVLNLDMDQLADLIKDPKRKIIEKMVAKVCLMGIKTGDPKYLEFMLDRLFGKTINSYVAQINSSFEGNSPSSTNSERRLTLAKISANIINSYEQREKGVIDVKPDSAKDSTE